MDLEALLKEIGAHTTLAATHPIKLDRLHRGLFDLPDPLYMQMGCDLVHRQILAAAEALRAMIKIVGAGNLPLAHTEIARRKVGTFELHVMSFDVEHGTMPFRLAWEAKTSTWRVTVARAGVGDGVSKSVPTLEKAIEKSMQWAAELEAQLRENAEDLVAAPVE
jgi:hypothetical protein